MEGEVIDAGVLAAPQQAEATELVAAAAEDDRVRDITGDAMVVVGPQVFYVELVAVEVGEDVEGLLQASSA